MATHEVHIFFNVDLLMLRLYKRAIVYFLAGKFPIGTLSKNKTVITALNDSQLMFYNVVVIFYKMERWCRFVHMRFPGHN